MQPSNNQILKKSNKQTKKQQQQQKRLKMAANSYMMCDTKWKLWLNKQYD